MRNVVGEVHLNTVPEGHGPHAMFEIRDVFHSQREDGGHSFRVLEVLDDDGDAVLLFFSDAETWARLTDIVNAAPPYPDSDIEGTIY